MSEHHHYPKFVHNPKALRSATTVMPWLIWGLAATFYGYEFLQRVSISVYLPFLLHDLKSDATAIGFMSAFYYYAYASMQIPAGILIDWLGVKRLATLGVFLVSLGAFLFATVHNVEVGAAARLLMGLGSAFAFICCMKLIIIWFPASRFAFIAGLTNLAGYAGATIGEVPLTNFVHHFSWRTASYTLGFLGLILTVSIYLVVRDKPYSHHKVRKSAPDPKKIAPHVFEGLQKVIKNGRNWINGFYGGLMVGPTSAFAALWGVNFLVQTDHISARLAAGALSAIFVGVALGSPTFGWWSDFLGKRQPLLIFAAAGSLAASCSVLFINNLPVEFLFLACFAFGFFQSAHVLNFAKAKDLNPRKISGTAMGFTNMMVMLGGAALQPIIGILLDWRAYHAVGKTISIYTQSNYHFALGAIPICQSLALIIAIFFLQDIKKPMAQRR